MGKLLLGFLFFLMWIPAARGVDFSGNGLNDVAIFRPSTGLWAVRGLSRAYFGREGDIPVPGNYVGEGNRIAIFRPVSGRWEAPDVGRVYFGQAGDLPIPGDYNGNGIDEVAVFRPSTGLWAVRGLTRVYFGRSGDVPVPAGYRDQGIDEIAVFRPSSGLWAAGGSSRFYFGRDGDIPVPGDYDGSGRARPAIFRPASGLWSVRGLTRLYFGTGGDQPKPGDYTGDGTDNFAIVRPSTGLWAVRSLTRLYFGSSEDMYLPCDLQSLPLPVTTPVPAPPPLNWRDGYDMDTLAASGGAVEFWTRNIQKPESRNRDGGHEYIIARVHGQGINRLLIMSMYDRRPRISLDWVGEGYRFRDGCFQQPLPGPSHWRVDSNGSRVWIELDGREIWSETGPYHVERAVMGGYRNRGFLGQWSAAD